MYVQCMYTYVCMCVDDVRTNLQDNSLDRSVRTPLEHAEVVELRGLGDANTSLQGRGYET